MQDGQSLAVVTVTDDTVAIPADVLLALGTSPGDTIVFVCDDRGLISLAKGRRRGPKPSVGEFADGEKLTPDENLALVRVLRYGDELDG